MNCESCTELLADFLLDELPESEAVLVQEHLNLCPDCMKKYKELKGTGKALEAVVAMQPVKGSQKFGDEVRKNAAVESAIIVAKLPPDRRLRLEARRAARHSRSLTPQKPPSVWNASLLLVVLAAAVVLSALIISSLGKNTTGQRDQIGKLSIAIGSVEQFFQKKNEPHTPAKEGTPVLRGDAFNTGENGRARFDIEQEGSVFIGPSSDLTFRLPSGDSENIVLVLEKGELGVECDPHDAAQSKPPWEIRLAGGHVKLSRNAHVYVKETKAGTETTSELFVLAGGAEVSKQGGKAQVSVDAGQRIAISKKSDELKTESIADARVPAWRVELFGEKDLAQIVNGDAKILARRDEGVQVEISYSRRPKRPGEFEDWSSEPAGTSLSESLALPPRIRFRHGVHLSAPMSAEFNVSPESNREVSFAFGILESQEGAVVVDVLAKEVLLQVLEQARTLRRESIPARAKPGEPESLRVEVVKERNALLAVLTSSTGRTKPLALPKPNAAGEIWIQPLGEGIILDGIKLTGILPSAWLRERLSRSTSLP